MTIRDETRLLEDQQDVTADGPRVPGIELGSSSNPLEASLARGVRAMRSMAD